MWKIGVLLHVALALSGCANYRGGLSDAVLDATIARADTPPDRLLRAHLVHAALVRVAGARSLSNERREEIAVASQRLSRAITDVVRCALHGPNVEAARDLTNLPISLDPRGADAQLAFTPFPKGACPFFESRFFTIDAAEVRLARLVLESSTTDFRFLGSIISGATATLAEIVALAENVIRDATILSAIRTDFADLLARNPLGIVATSPGPRGVITVSDRARAGRAPRTGSAILVADFVAVTQFLELACTALGTSRGSAVYKDCMQDALFSRDKSRPLL